MNIHVPSMHLCLKYRVNADNSYEYYSTFSGSMDLKCNTDNFYYCDLERCPVVKTFIFMPEHVHIITRRKSGNWKILP